MTLIPVALDILASANGSLPNPMDVVSTKEMPPTRLYKFNSEIAFCRE